MLELYLFWYCYYSLNVKTKCSLFQIATLWCSLEGWQMICSLWTIITPCVQYKPLLSLCPALMANWPANEHKAQNLWPWVTSLQSTQLVHHQDARWRKMCYLITQDIFMIFTVPECNWDTFSFPRNRTGTDSQS